MAKLSSAELAKREDVIKTMKKTSVGLLSAMAQMLKK